MKKHFLLFSFAFPPKNVVGSLRPYRLCRYLPDYGWWPTVVTADSGVSRNRPPLSLEGVPSNTPISRLREFEPLRLLSRGKKVPKRRKLKGFSLSAPAVHQAVSVPTYPQGPPPTIAGLMRMLLSDLFETPDSKLFWGLSAYISGFRILSKSDAKHRLVITTSPPHSSQVFGCILARTFGLPHIMDLRDPWTDIYRGYKTPFRNQLEKVLEAFAVRSSSYVISSTDTYTAVLQKRYKDIPPNRFLTITNSFEEEKFASAIDTPSERFVIAYLGIFYPMRNPYCFFYALKQWLDAHPERRNKVEFRIIGDSDPTTNRMIASLGLSDIALVTGRVPHEKAIQLTKSGDLLLMATGTGPATPRGWIPSKLFEYLASRKPILANIPEGDASEIIRKTNSGYVVSNEDTTEIEKILEREYFRKHHHGEPGLEFLPYEEKVEQYGTRAVMRQFAQTFDNAIN